MRLLHTSALLIVLNLLIFSVLYASDIFNAYIFKSISLALAALPLTGILRTLLLMLWLTVPQSVLLYGVNALWFKLPTKKFCIIQALFAVVAVIVLYLALIIF